MRFTLSIYFGDTNQADVASSSYHGICVSTEFKYSRTCLCPVRKLFNFAWALGADLGNSGGLQRCRYCTVLWVIMGPKKSKSFGM